MNLGKTLALLILLGLILIFALMLATYLGFVDWRIGFTISWCAVFLLAMLDIIRVEDSHRRKYAKG